MDTDPDDPAVFYAITEEGDEGDEGEEGPECGTAEALSDLMVCFIDEGTMRFLERHCCCFRHIPDSPARGGGSGRSKRRMNDGSEPDHGDPERELDDTVEFHISWGDSGDRDDPESPWWERLGSGDPAN